jgi:hypothetical protein
LGIGSGNAVTDVSKLDKLAEHRSVSGHSSMGALVLAPVLLSFFVPIVVAQMPSDTPYASALKGVRAVSVSASMGQDCGASEWLLKQDIETKLRVARIKIDLRSSDKLNARISCISIDRGSGKAAYVSLTVVQPGRTDSLPAESVFVMTWSIERLVPCGRSASCDEFLRARLGDQVDTFINEYLSVNQQ